MSPTHMFKDRITCDRIMKPGTSKTNIIRVLRSIAIGFNLTYLLFNTPLAAQELGVDVNINDNLPSSSSLVSKGFPDVAPKFGFFIVGTGIKQFSAENDNSRGITGSVGWFMKSNSGLRAGLGIMSRQFDTIFGNLDSSSAINAIGLGGWVAYEPNRTGIRLLLATNVLDLNTTIKRNYISNASIETSTGKADGKYYGIQAQFGYTFKYKEHSKITPFIGIETGTAKFDGYHEAGGTFPGFVTEQSTQLKSGRIGIKGQWNSSSQLIWRGSVSIAHSRQTGTSPLLTISNLPGNTLNSISDSRSYQSTTFEMGANYALSNRTILFGNIKTTASLGTRVRDIDTANLTLGLTIGF